MKKILNKWQLLLALAFSLIFATVYIIGRNIVYTGGIKGYPTENYMTMPGSDDAAALVIAFVLAFAAIILLYRICCRFELQGRDGSGEKKLMLLSMILLLVAWLPYLLTCYPGILYGDAYFTLTEFLEAGHPVDNHHPVLYTYLTAGAYYLGLALGDAAIGLYIFILLHTLVMALVISRVICFVYRRGAHGILVAAVMLFYAFVPVFPGYAVAFWKDPLYTCALTLLMLELYKFSSQDVSARNILLIALLSLLSCFLRNNGIYVIIALSVCLVLSAVKYKVRIASVFVLLIAVYYLVTTVGYRSFDIKPKFVESVGVPIQQMASVIYYDGALSEEETEYLYELMPQWAWQEYYSPCIVDSIKWNYFFNEQFLDETKGEFLKTWFGVVVKNPVTVVRAYLMETHGFWVPGACDAYEYLDLNAAAKLEVGSLDIGYMDLFEKIFGFSIQDKLDALPENISAGTLFWITALGLLLVILKKRRSWIIYVPALANWITVMISAPCAYGLRYVYIFVFALPLFVLVPFVKEKKTSEE